MHKPGRTCGMLVLMLATANVAIAAGLNSMGNTDGVLTWRLGTVPPGKKARHVVLFAYDKSHEAVAKRLEQARKRFAEMPQPAALKADKPEQQPLWIHSDAIDFALEGNALFRWRMKRQALASSAGGQLSQFTWYVHYRDETGQHRAGTPHVDQSKPENVRLVEPVHRTGPQELAALLETEDKRLRIRVRAAIGEGSTVGVEFVLTNLHDRPLADMRLSSYANIEAAHTHEGDYSCLDSRTAGLLVVDPPTGTCVAMAGLQPPASGYSGTWLSLEKLQNPSGIALER